MNEQELQSLKITLVEINNDLKSMVQKQEDLHNDIKDVKSATFLRNEKMNHNKIPKNNRKNTRI